MPHKSLVDFVARNDGTIALMLLAVIGVIGRAFYTGAPWRQTAGDLILCPTFTFAVEPLIPSKIYGVNVTPELVALLIGIAGVHGIRWLVSRKAKLTSGRDKP
ncbi:phage holin family protein [Salmonella enterica]|uniref:phage holin family protein n=1 Tax=Salmonella enterica TaxID=28901 RepID=UPI001D37CF12|nr:phage holin family protein [Salmonella enterica]EHQ0666423.1 phage holin family protein [Salmonella enterica subsp. enterica serovar Oranienburg]HDH3765888.1 phage holin family protein [Salmonella enterica subsp. enterica serovar Oranienburg]HDH3807881.1 phage holin family protein [Salmonella enterica subsp. enterica serovar Oranienburg]HDH3817999.1 phage holin family protein [Salmonella enterica subsp. enterica serovar Oranienburg]HDH3824494.1 phage holin family protein [Salmonella enteric